MRRKFWIAFVCILIVLGGFILLSSTTIKIQKDIVITANVSNVAGQITDLRNWRHWYPGLTGRDSAAFTYSDNRDGINSFLKSGNQLFSTIRYTPAEISVKESTGGKKVYQSLYAMPETTGIRTRLTWIMAVSPLTSSKEKFALANTMETGLNNLKNFAEDPAKMYGFPLEIRPVKDTLVLAQKVVVVNKDKIATLSRLYSNLYQYIKKNNIQADKNSHRIANFTAINKDSIQILACVPVTRAGISKKDFTYLRFPKEGRMLVGTYNGPYSRIDQLHLAMQKYIRDKHLSIAAPDCEKYFTDPVTLQDSLNMSVEVCYPIY